MTFLSKYFTAPTAHGRTDLQYQDIDKENELDTFQSPEYAQDIFNYYKSKEVWIIACKVEELILAWV